MAAASGGGVGREGSAEASVAVADQISQSIQSTSNLLHLMLQSSSSHVQLMKLPKNLLAKTTTIKSTQAVLEQMPQVISSFDAHVESGLQSMSHLDTVVQLLSNMQRTQLKSLSTPQLTQESQQEPEHPEQHSQVAEISL